MRKTIVFLVVSASVIALLGAELSRARNRRGRAPADDRQEHLNVDGVDRTYFLHIPESQAASGSAPLVLVFHGGGGHASTMPNFTHFDAVADREGFLVAYPESFNKSWNDTRGLSPADDVGLHSRPDCGVATLRTASIQNAFTPPESRMAVSSPIGWLVTWLTNWPRSQR